MKLSVAMGTFYPTRDRKQYRTMEELFKICSDAGFTTLEVTPSWGADWKESTDKALQLADKYGVEIEQAHAPANFYPRQSPESFALILDRSVESAIRMNLKQLVFHMDEYHDPSAEEFDPEEGLKCAYETLAPHVEKALAGGVKVALETIFEDRITTGKPGRTHFGGTIEELTASIEKFNHPDVGCCWDFGHSAIAYGEKQCDVMRQLGKHIICTHTHDNYYNRDLHVMPFMGQLPWEPLMHTLKEIGYQGSLSFEFAYGRYPDRIIEDFLKLAYKTGLVLVDMFEGKEIR